MKQIDHRRAPRKPVRLVATFSYLAGTWVSTTGEAVTLDLSAGGALIRSSHAPEIGAILSLTLTLEDRRPVVLEGRVTRVVRAREGYDIGVAFRNLTAEDQYLIELQVLKRS
jgi:hypothetical protein